LQVIFIFFSIGVIMIPIGVVCLHYGLQVGAGASSRAAMPPATADRALNPLVLRSG
jgi:hypothetical protein